MTYELALKLKEAGYPQRDWFFIDHIVDGKVVDRVHSPTLLELIEACKDGFYSLHFDRDERFGTFYCIGKNIRVGGNTPEEAVALLWISLNKKDSNTNPIN